MASIFALSAFAILGQRIYHQLHPAPALLTLDDDIQLVAPPDVPQSDRPAVKDQFEQLVPMRTNCEANQGDAAGWLSLAQQAEKAGDLVTSCDAYGKSIPLVLAPDPAVLVRMANCEGALGRYEADINHAKQALDLRPDEIETHLVLARAQAGISGPKAMAEELEKAAKIVRPNDIPGRLRLADQYADFADPERALVVIRDAVPSADEKVDTALSETRLLLRLNRFDEAYRILAELLKGRPNLAQAHRLLATYYFNPLNPKRSLRLAEHHFLTVLNIDPKDVVACDQLGRVYMELSRYKQAVYLFRWLVFLVPASGTARMQLSQAYTAYGDSQAAAAQRTLATRLIAEETRERDLRMARNQRPRDPGARLALGRQYLAMGHFREALIELEAAHDLTPSSAPYANALASACREVGVQPPPSWRLAAQ